jgi:uncharacterized membrane protein (UPF0127 family)
MFRRQNGAEHWDVVRLRRRDAGQLLDAGTTYIPLDMIFVKADGTVESIAERTTPLSENSVKSRGPVRYVLEINGGLSDELGIEPGDKLSGPALDPDL